MPVRCGTAQRSGISLSREFPKSVSCVGTRRVIKESDDVGRFPFFGPPAACEEESETGSRDKGRSLGVFCSPAEEADLLRELQLFQGIVQGIASARTPSQ